MKYLTSPCHNMPSFGPFGPTEGTTSSTSDCRWTRPARTCQKTRLGLCKRINNFFEKPELNYDLKNTFGCSKLLETRELFQVPPVDFKKRSSKFAKKLYYYPESTKHFSETNIFKKIALPLPRIDLTFF